MYQAVCLNRGTEAGRGKLMCATRSPPPQVISCLLRACLQKLTHEQGSFAYSSMQTKLKGRYYGKRPLISKEDSKEDWIELLF